MPVLEFKVAQADQVIQTLQQMAKGEIDAAKAAEKIGKAFLDAEMASGKFTKSGEKVGDAIKAQQREMQGI